MVLLSNAKFEKGRSLSGFRIIATITNWVRSLHDVIEKHICLR